MHLFGLPGKILKTAFPAVVFLACISLPAFCQKEKTDSLFRLVQNHPGDRQLRKDFNAAFRKWNADSALKFSMQQVKLAQDSVTKGDWLMYSGVLIDQLNQPVKAEKFYRESYNTLLAAGDTFNLDDCSNSLGYVLARLGKYKDSKKYLDQALALRDASKDTLGMTGTLLNLGFLYSDMEDDTRLVKVFF